MLNLNRRNFLFGSAAAAALTVPCLPEAVRGTSAEWLVSLGIRPERYRSR